MKFKGSKADGKAGNSYAANEGDEEEIPIITDAIVVNDVEEPEIVLPPATNPDHKPAQNQQQVMIPAGQATAAPVFMPQTQPVMFEPMHMNMGRSSTGLLCPHCKRQTITFTQDAIGVWTIVWVFILALFFWPLCWLPFCIPACHRTNHFCGHETCRRKVGETSVCS